jgi:hypothetical protein
MVYAEGQFFKRAHLRRIGWTNGIIGLLMPEPDGSMTTDHPWGRIESFRIYRRDRAKAFEATPDFQRMIAERLVRRKALGGRCGSPLELLLDGIVLPVVAWSQHVNLAFDNYNEWCLNHCNFWIPRISPRSSPSPVARLCVNYLRHNLTDYDKILNENVRKLGIHVYPLVKCKVIEQIATKYLRLVGECHRQFMLMKNASKGATAICSRA